MEKMNITEESLLSVRRAGEGDLPSLSTLLASEDLPISDLGSHIQLFIWQASPDPIVAIGGWEQYEDIGLLRSVLIPSAHRGTGIGRKWVQWLVEEAMRTGIQHFYLLTTTAVPFFEKMGFASIDRAEVPASIQQTNEFSSLCPGSAVVMYKVLNT